MKASARFKVMAMLFLLPLFLHCGNKGDSHYYNQGALATAAPIATQIGESVFRSGGNAFDVAVAVGFALAVVHPEAGNIGGGGFALMRDGQTGDMKSLDFREKAPALAHEKMYLDKKDSVIKDLSTIGANAVGVPGTVTGLYELWKTYGSIKWEELVDISAKLADSGFVLDQYQSDHFKKFQDRLSVFKESADLYFPDGKALMPGERLAQSDLSRTLSLIASGGPDSFYVGSIADSLVSTVERHGGIITHEDLKNYAVVWREPMSFEFDSLMIYSMPPPSSGGIVMAQILKMLEPYDFSNLTPDSVRYVHLFCEAARLAYADRSQHLGDPDFYEIPDFLLNQNYLAKRASLINKNHANISQDIAPGNFVQPESKQTTHFSVADDQGNLIAVTYTLNSSYGSKLAVHGCGFLLNNEMDDFAIAPGHANLYGLVGGRANKVEPDKRMLSSMTPTIVMKNNRPFMILGSPGGSEIITAVTQTILNMTRFNLPPQKSVSRPRIHHQWLPDLLKIEENSFDIHLKQGLIKLGHNIKEFKTESEIQLVYIDENGQMLGVSDPRERGTAGGF